MVNRLFMVILLVLALNAVNAAVAAEGIARDGIVSVCINFTDIHGNATDMKHAAFSPTSVTTRRPVFGSIVTENPVPAPIIYNPGSNRFRIDCSDEQGNKVWATFRWDNTGDKMFFNTSWPSYCTVTFVKFSYPPMPRWMKPFELTLICSPGNLYNHTVPVSPPSMLRSIRISCTSAVDLVEHKGSAS